MTRSRRVLALGAAVVLVAAGCSGDQSEVIAAGDTAEAEVIAALDAATSGTGRIEITVDVDDDALTAVWERMERHWAEQNPEDAEAVESRIDDGFVAEHASSMDVVLSGVYSGSDYLLSPDDESEPTALRVGDRTFASARESLERYRFSSEGLGESVHVELPDPPTLPEGIEWVETDVPNLPVVNLPSGKDSGAHLVRSAQLEGIAEAGASEVDGVPTRRYTASFTKAALADFAELDFGYLDEEEDAEGALDEEHAAWLAKSRAMDEALRDYVIEHADTEVEIHLDADGRLVRVGFTSGIEIDPAYADCFVLLMSSTPLTMTADYSELGSEVDIAEPAASSVMSDSDFSELLYDTFASWSPGGAPLPHMPSDFSFGPDDEPVKLQTVDGERYRADIEDDLVKFGSVIDFDPASVRDLDDAALVEAHDRASAAIAALPTTTTALGELSRVELLWNVRWGMQTLGIDPAMADAMDDQQLAALIDAHVAEQGVVGDGIWGDGPMSYAEMFSEDFLGGESVELSEEELEELEAEFGDAESWFDEMYAGCPGA